MCSTELPKCGRHDGGKYQSRHRTYGPDLLDAKTGIRHNERVAKHCSKFGTKWGESPSSTITDSQFQSSQLSNVKYFASFNMLDLVWILAAAGVVVASIVYHVFSREHYRHYEHVLASMCDERARMLQHQFAVSMNHVHALAIMVSTFYFGRHPTAINQDTFAEYTARTAFERPLMTGVAYAHRVLHFEREVFERNQGWTIKTMHSKEPSPVYNEYAPTIFSQETIGHIVSLDMMSGEEDRDNIFRSRASGKGALTKPFRLLKSNHLGVVLTYPVYKKEVPPDATITDRIEAVAGYLGGAFDVESLVETLLSQLAKGEDIVVNVFDITNSSSPLVMYGPDTFESDMEHMSTLDFGDPFRKHEMRCRLASRVPLPRLALGFASGVLLFVALICSMVYNAHKHVKKVEEGYRKMEELKVQAEAADVAKSQFLATVSHEIRTPMNGVLGMLQMLLDTQLNAAQQDFARTAQASGKALITLINEVLDQAKIESGRIELEAVPFDIRAILDDVLSLFSTKTRDEGVELAGFVSERVPSTLIGDPGRLRQIIANLVGNSVKFTKRGHIFVCVHLWEDMELMPVVNAEATMTEKHSGGKFSTSTTLSGYKAANKQNSWDTFKYLLSKEKFKSSSWAHPVSELKLFISVEDTGIGIPLEAQKRIFMPFMQADSSTSRIHGGTGIGLSISRCLVELMRGEMHFESKESIGSTFTCTLVLKSGNCSGTSEENRNASSEALATKFQGMKALIVDGRPLRSEVTKHYLQRLGIRVRTVFERKLAVEMVFATARSGEGEFDMVLVDKDAWGTCTGLTFPHLVQQSHQKNEPTISRKELYRPNMILMAISMTSDECKKARAMGYEDTVIMKPLRARMIAACLEQVLSSEKNGQYNGVPKEGPKNLSNLLSRKQILVVDDNKINRLVAAGALKKYGAQVVCADSGKDAILKLCPPHTFDACFMDIQMPEMDGFEATQKIREVEKMVNESNELESLNRERNWHVPILAMTADTTQATYDECARCKMDGYVSKPFEEEELYQAISQVLTM